MSEPPTSPSMPFRLGTLTFTGGQQIDVADADVVVLVGPNNAGKTRSLSDIHQLLSNHRGNPAIQGLFAIEELTMANSSSRSELMSWIRRNRYHYRQSSDPIITDSEEGIRFRTTSTPETVSWAIDEQWASEARLGDLARHLVGVQFASNRLGIVGTPGRLAPGSHPDHLVHSLIDDTTLASFAATLWRSFGWHVVLDAWGPSLVLRVSDQPQSAYAGLSATGLASEELQARLAQLPTLEMQSDGVRSFSGLILSLITAAYPLTLIDEPEAFLHPPQARQLGRSINELRRDGQIVLATHDINIVMGLLDSARSRVSVVRVRRNQDAVDAHALGNAELRRLWDDPLLRYSRALDGLFHDGTVLCEGDTDCQFYSSVSDWLAEQEAPDEDARRRPDLLFAQPGGKQRMPPVVDALRSVATPVAVIVDFDALNDEAQLTRLATSMGISQTDLSEVRRFRGIVDAHLRGDKTRRTKERYESEAAAALTAVAPDEELSAAVRSQLGDLLRPVGGWGLAKSTGSTAVPSGVATVALKELLTLLEQSNIFVVRSGEVESFVRQVGGRSNAWIAEVLERGLIGGATGSHELVNKVVKSFKD